MDKDSYLSQRVIAVTEKKPWTLKTQEYQFSWDMFIYRFVVWLQNLLQL